MIGATLGPYRLERELGAGGMGTVYLATAVGDGAPVEPGARVAVKIVHAQLLSTPGFFKRFLREADTGRRVIHENVVRTFDADALMHDGRSLHFLVMEYVEGRTLRAMLGDLGTVPEALLRELATQIASGLAAIHAAGVVHRDLKPENVLVTPDHRVRIMDLGVARLQEASVAITREGQFAGSLLYAAPEQFRGREVGPAADLYSVGVTLYELAAGRNPFHAADAAGVIHAHLNVVPDRLDRANEDVSAFLAEVIAALLEKAPENRLASAEALRETLELGEGSTWWAEREPAVLKARRGLPKVQVGRETPLHGRETEMALLRESWERARLGQGSTVLFEGEAGIGKTRLVDSFLHDVAAATESNVLYGSYPPAGGMGGLSNAVIARFGAANLEDALRPYLTVTPSLVPAFAALTKHEHPPAGADALQGDALHAVFVHLLRALAAEKPLVWVVDDLHFAAAESLKIVLSLARAVEGHRVLLLLTSRPGLPEDELAHFARTGAFHRVPVGRLSPRQVIELVRDALKNDVLADRLGARIAYKSDGVPFFVFEMIRGLKEGRFLAQQADGTFVETRVVGDIEVPSAVRDLIESRLKGFTKEDRALLDVGAVMGFEFDAGLVAMVLERKKVGVLQDLAEIERRTGVVRSGGGGCRFDHHQIQDVLYAGLMDDLRREYHAMLVDAFKQREGVDPTNVADLPGESAVFLASHALRGSRPKDAAPFLEAALSHLEKSYFHAEAVELCDRALAAKGLLAGTARLDVVQRRGSRLSTIGRRGEAVAALREAVALADSTGDVAARARSRMFLGDCLLYASQFDEMERHFADAVELARAAGSTDVEARVENSRGVAARYQGDDEAQRRHLERAVALWAGAGNQAQLAKSTANLGVAAFVTRGDYGAALAPLLELLAVGRATGNKLDEAISASNCGEIWTDLGQHARARPSLDAAVAVATESGHRYTMGLALANRARLEFVTGDAASALRSANEAFAVTTETADDRAAADVLCLLAQIHASCGDAVRARGLLESSVAKARETKHITAFVVGSLRLALLGGGDAAAALELFRANDPKIEFRERMECCLLAWRLTGDRAHLAEAHKMLQIIRRQVPPDCVESMMSNPLHHDIAAAWAADGAHV